MPPPDGLALATLRRVVGLLRPWWRRTLLAFALGVAMMAITTAVPWITRTIIDDGLTRRVPGVLARQTLLLLGLALLRWLLSGLRRNVSGRVGTDVERDLRNRLARRLLALEPGWHDQAQTGQLLSRATSDIRSVRYFLSWGLVFTVLNLLTFVIAGVQMWLLSPRLALVVLALGPPLVLGAVRYNGRLHRVFWQVQQELGDLTTVVEENAAGVRVVKAFGREREEAAKLEGEARAVLDHSLEAARLRAFYTPLLQALPQLSLAAVLWYGGRLAASGAITLGTLVAFNSYLLLLAWPLQSLGMLFGFAQRAAASAERVFEVTDAVPAIADAPGAPALPEPAPGRPRGATIAFEDVSFWYGDRSDDGRSPPAGATGPAPGNPGNPGNPGASGASGPPGAAPRPRPARPILDHVTLQLPAGARVALVGGTGSGKSTLAALVARVYQASDGRVLVDGHDVRDVTLDSLRAAVAVVHQEPVLFSATLRENVAFGQGQAHAADSDVLAALRAAAALDVVEALPDGLDTVIGEQGYTLSGGQRQRVALARGLLMRPRVLILDDALSHVDTETEARILAGLDGWLAGPDGGQAGRATVLLVANRHASLALADRIVLLERGRVVAQGSHAELLEQQPRYRDVLAHAAGDVDRLIAEAAP